MRAPAAALLVLLAGCLQGAEDGLSAATAPLPAPALPSAYGFACPPGETTTTAAGVCVRTIASRTESNQEPYLALDPARPGVMAVGVNAGHTTGAVSADRPQPGLDLIRMDIFVTEDGGATWTRHELPYIPSKRPPTGVDTGGSGDPALAFDEHGVLHVSGIVNWGTFQRQGYEIFYTSSADLGRTWSEPVVLTDDSDNDRNWITVAPGGRVYVPWQNVGESSQVAWSADGGATWAVSGEVEDCITASVVAMHGDEPYLACAGIDDGFDSTGIRVHHLAPDGALHEVAVVHGEDFAVWPQLATPTDGSLVLAFDDGPTVRFARMAAGEDAFGPALDLREAATLDDAWDRAFIYWVAADRWGALHFLLGGGFGGQPVGFLRVGGQSALVHVVVDPADGRLVSEALLRDSRDGTKDARVPPTLAPAYGDHYYGLAFDDERGHVVYTRDKGLDLTTLVPEP